MATAKKPASPAAKKAKAPWEGALDKGLVAAKKVVPKKVAAIEKPAPKPAAPVKEAKAKVGSDGKPVFKAPKSLALAADRCYIVREERLNLTRTADGMKAEEGFLRDYIIEKLPASDATGIAGQLVRASVKSKSQPVAKDWPKIYDFIVASYLKEKKLKTGREHGAFALLNKALNGATVEELWEAKVAVPGVEKINVKSVSFNKL